MSADTPPQFTRPSLDNLNRGYWFCLILPAVSKSCTYLYKSIDGELYLGKSILGEEGWFGRDQIQRAYQLWSIQDGFEHWLYIGHRIPSEPIGIGVV